MVCSYTGWKNQSYQSVWHFCPIKLFQFFKDFRGIVDNPKTIDACVPSDAFAVLFKMIGNYF